MKHGHNGKEQALDADIILSTSMCIWLSTLDMPCHGGRARQILDRAIGPRGGGGFGGGTRDTCLGSLSFAACNCFKLQEVMRNAPLTKLTHSLSN